jgi:hypothetical protein
MNLNDPAAYSDSPAPNERTVPPPLPHLDSTVASGFAEDYHAMPETSGTWDLIQALLKHPGTVVHTAVHDRSARFLPAILGAAIVCLAAYGLIMGSFSGASQYWMSPLKLTAGTLLSGLICLPSLYIFSCMGGANQTLPHAAKLLLLFIALQGILLLGFTPIAWVFTQSTQSLAFMGTLHLVFWLIAAFCGLRLLWAAFDFLNRKPMIILRAWSVLFVVVALQMGTALRPLLGNPGDRWPEGKKFFLAHWVECIESR